MGDKKKRKRENESGELPNKRHEATPPSTTVKVNIFPESGDLGPIIASTAGCQPPSDALFDTYKRSVEKTSEYEVLLHSSSSHPALDYTASEEKSGRAESLLKHYVGIYDPATSRLNIAEAHHVVLRGKLRLTQSEVDEEVQAQEERNKIERKTNRDARQALGMEFGTKKAKRAINDSITNAINPQQRGKDALTNGIAGKDERASALLEIMNANTAGLPTREERQAAIDDAKPRPTADLDAQQPQDVYLFQQLIPESLLRSLEVHDWIQKAKNNVAIVTHSRYVARRVHDLASAKEMAKLRALRYILTMIDFKAACSPTKNGGFKLPKDREILQKKVDAPSAIIDDIRQKFSEKGELSKWHSDFFHTHLCALALHVDDFATDTHDLREDLRLSVVQMQQYFRELGCRVTPPTDKEREKLKLTKAEAPLHKFARLKMPLEFPKEKRTAKKR